MDADLPLIVSCPSCRAVLKVDRRTGAVLSHEVAGATASKKDMGEALQALKEGKGRREEIFNQSMSAEKNKTDLLKKKFDEAVRKAKETPDAPPPAREIDL